jgi:alpha-tubulin suppressor-like RCC1 family protein
VGCGGSRERAASAARGARLAVATVVCLLLAALGMSGIGPARADQAESPVRRVAAASITAGEEHTCALLITGAVRCWGYGGDGELGYNSASSVGDDPARPMEAARNVPLGGKATAITAGAFHTCALLTTGAVRAGATAATVRWATTRPRTSATGADLRS